MKTMTAERTLKEVEKAIFRLENIEKKFADSDEKIMQHINLRTQRMTNPYKLGIWHTILKNRGYTVH